MRCKPFLSLIQRQVCLLLIKGFLEDLLEERGLVALKLVGPDVITRGPSLLHHVILMIFSLRSFSRPITGGARVAARCLMSDSSQLMLKDV